MCLVEQINQLLQNLQEDTIIDYGNKMIRLIDTIQNDEALREREDISEVLMYLEYAMLNKDYQYLSDLLEFELLELVMEVDEK